MTSTSVLSGGRPRKADDDRRSAQIAVRLTPAEHALVLRAAAAVHLHPVEYLRRRTLAPHSISEHARRLDRSGMVTALNKIGGLVKLLSLQDRHAADRAQLATTLAELRAVLERLA